MKVEDNEQVASLEVDGGSKVEWSKTWCGKRIRVGERMEVILTGVNSSKIVGCAHRPQPRVLDGRDLFYATKRRTRNRQKEKVYLTGFPTGLGGLWWSLVRKPGYASCFLLCAAGGVYRRGGCARRNVSGPCRISCCWIQGSSFTLLPLVF